MSLADARTTGAGTVVGGVLGRRSSLSGWATVATAVAAAAIAIRVKQIFIPRLLQSKAGLILSETHR